MGMKIDGLSEVLEQVEDIKKTANNTTGANIKISRGKEVREIADRLKDAGYFTDKEYCEVLLDVADSMGFHLREYKN